MPTTATTQATPMMMPSAVRSDRSLLRERARNATLRMFPVLVTALSGPAPQRLVEDLQRLVHLAGAHDERRGDADDVAVEAPLADQEAAFLRLLEQAYRLFGRGRPVLNGLVGHELEALHEAHAAHVADRLRVLFLQAVKAVTQAPAHLGGAFRRVHLLHDFDRGVRGGRGDRVPAERRDRERLERVRDLRRRDRDPERHPVRDPFGHRHDLGLDVPVRDAEPGAASAPEARLHLVADEDAAVLPHDPDRDLEILLRGRDESANALDGLGDEARDLAGRRRLDQLFEVLGARDAAGRVRELQRAAVAVRRGCVLDGGDLRRHRAPRRVPGERLREHRPAGIAVPEGDDLEPPRVDLRHHDAGLVGLCARAREGGLLEPPRRQPRELLGELDDGQRRIERRDMAESVHLRLDGGVYLVVRVPDGDRQDAAEKVEVRLPVGVSNMHPLAGFEDDGLLVVVRDGGEEKLLVLRADVSGRKSLCFGNRAHVRTFLLRKLPLPALPTNVPFSTITSPREMTVSAAPWTTRPSYGV